MLLCGLGSFLQLGVGARVREVAQGSACTSPEWAAAGVQVAQLIAQGDEAQPLQAASSWAGSARGLRAR